MAGDGSTRVLTPGTAAASGGSTEGEAVDAEYLRTVLQEVRRREQRLAKLDEERRNLDFEISKLSADRAAKRGDAGGLRMLETFRRSLQARAAKLQAGWAEAKKDLDKALERKRQVEEEFEQQSKQIKRI